MPNHPNQQFAMHNDWQPDLSRLQELLWFRFQMPAPLCQQIFQSKWFVQKLNEFRHEQENRFDEYLDPIKNNEYGWSFELARMLKASYVASKRVNEKIQRGEFQDNNPNDPQFTNIKQLLKQTEPALQQPASPLFDIQLPDSVDNQQLERFLQFAEELNGRKPLRSQIETWVSQLANMSKSEQAEQINYSISIGKTIIYPPRNPSRLTSEQAYAGVNIDKNKSSNKPSKKQLEQEKHKLNLSFNGIRLAAHIHKAALAAFLDERFQAEGKAMTPTRLQTLVDMLSSMSNEEQVEAIRQSIIGNYKTIYPPKKSQGTPRTAMQAAKEAADKMKRQQQAPHEQAQATKPNTEADLKKKLFLNRPES